MSKVLNYRKNDEILSSKTVGKKTGGWYLHAPFIAALQSM